jgi:hypothetical protein
MKTRYIVTGINWQEKQRLARLAGWDGKDADMVSSYVEPQDGEIQYGPFSSLSRAFTRAKQALMADSYAQTSIYLQVETKLGWDESLVWYVNRDTKQIKRDEPDSEA